MATGSITLNYPKCLAICLLHLLIDIISVYITCQGTTSRDVCLISLKILDTDHKIFCFTSGNVDRDRESDSIPALMIVGIYFSIVGN